LTQSKRSVNGRRARESAWTSATLATPVAATVRCSSAYDGPGHRTPPRARSDRRSQAVISAGRRRVGTRRPGRARQEGRQLRASSGPRASQPRVRDREALPSATTRASGSEAAALDDDAAREGGPSAPPAHAGQLVRSEWGGRIVKRIRPPRRRAGRSCQQRHRPVRKRAARW
jgi:hypothetical protein